MSRSHANAVFTQRPERRRHPYVRLNRSLPKAVTGIGTPLLFDEVADNCPAGIVVISADGAIQYTNRRAEQMTGVQRDAYRSRDYKAPEWDVTDFDGKPQSADELAFSQVMRSGSPVDNVEHAVRRADGSRMYMKVSGQPIRGRDGRLSHVIFTMLDVSEGVQTLHALRRSERRFSSAFENAPIGKALVSLDGRFTLVNQSLCRILGYEKHDLEQRTFQSITHPDDLQADFQFVDDLLDGRAQTYQMRKRYQRGDGGIVWTRLSVTLVRDETHRPEYFISQIEDISESVEAERALRDGRLQLEKSLSTLQAQNREISELNELSSALQACLQVAEIEVPVRRTCRRLFPGYSGALFLRRGAEDHFDRVCQWGEAPAADHLRAPDCWALRRGHGHRHAGEDDLRCAHLGSGPRADSLCEPLVAQGETLGLLHLCATADREGDEAFVQRLSLIMAMAAERIALALANLNLRESLRQQSLRDPLTGLFNRRYLEECLRRDLEVAARNCHGLAVVMIDADHFKAYNDRHGHAAGDAALRAIALALQDQVRAGDAACRFGGEEFVLVQPRITLDVAQRRAQALRQRVAAAPVALGNLQLPPVTLSVGIALYPDHGLDDETLLQAADRALYQAKAAGRDCIRIADILPRR